MLYTLWFQLYKIIKITKLEKWRRMDANSQGVSWEKGGKKVGVAVKQQHGGSLWGQNNSVS